MRLAAVVGALAASVLLAACGGKGTPLAETARPCLEKLGLYVHHRPTRRIGVDTRPLLPVLDPDRPPQVDQPTPLLPWPEDFQEYGEVSFSARAPGANNVQVLIFGDDELPRRVLAATRRAQRAETFFSSVRSVRVGQSLVLWSSAPTAKQRTKVNACLEE